MLVILYIVSPIYKYHFRMSLLFSELNKSDMIYEGNLSSESTPTDNHSLISPWLSKCCDLPSKKSMLRQLNSSFKQQMSQMDVCFQEVGTKYNRINQIDTSSSHLKRNPQCDRTISSNPAYYETRPSNTEYLEHPLQFKIENIDTPSLCYQKLVLQQHTLQRQLESVAQLIGKKSNLDPSEIQKISSERAPIKWNLLMRQKFGLDHRELFQTSINIALQKANNSHNYDYIAYTESSRRDQSNPLKQFEKNCKGGTQSSEIHTNSNQQSKSQIYKSIYNRILSSPCTMKKTIHNKQISRTNDLFNRLSKQKRQRDKLLRTIKINLK